MLGFFYVISQIRNKSWIDFEDKCRACDMHTVKMRVARIALGETVASSSRVSSRLVSRQAIVPVSRRANHHGAFQPTPTRLDKGKRREDIKYDTGGVGHSIERQAYFANSASSEIGESAADWGSTPEDVMQGIEPGRVVECRRYGLTMKIADKIEKEPRLSA
jgi:hypothetical protein